MISHSQTKQQLASFLSWKHNKSLPREPDTVLWGVILFNFLLAQFGQVLVGLDGLRGEGVILPGIHRRNHGRHNSGADLIGLLVADDLLRNDTQGGDHHIGKGDDQEGHADQRLSRGLHDKATTFPFDYLNVNLSRTSFQ